MKFHSAKEDSAGSLFTLLGPVLLHRPVYCPRTAAGTIVRTTVSGIASIALSAQDEVHVVFASCTRMARIHQLQRFVGNKADIDTADAAHRTIFHSLRTITSQRDVERTQSVNLHLVALGERQTQLFHKCLDGVFHISGGQ